MARPKTMASRKLVSLPPDIAEAVDDFRFSNRIGTEAEAIRRLIEAGLKQLAPEQPRPAETQDKAPAA
jgi:hypothetical protein